jgi:hypothetical protein
MTIPLQLIVALGALIGSLLFLALPAVPDETSSRADVRVGVSLLANATDEGRPLSANEVATSVAPAT